MGKATVKRNISCCQKKKKRREKSFFSSKFSCTPSITVALRLDFCDAKFSFWSGKWEMWTIAQCDVGFVRVIDWLQHHCVKKCFSIQEMVHARARIISLVGVTILKVVEIYSVIIVVSHTFSICRFHMNFCRFFSLVVLQTNGKNHKRDAAEVERVTKHKRRLTEDA